jgi:cytochrome c oxidase subunit II
VFTSIHRQFSMQGKDSSFQPIRLRNRLGHAVRIFGVILLIIGLSASSTKSASPHHIEVVAKRFAFEPAEITVKKGEPVDLVLTSVDVNHGVRIRELGVDLRATKGKKADANFTPQSAGTFVGHCSVFCGSGHGQMKLIIHVVS